jgi:N4-gp56 family major capsid protein
MAQVWSTNSLGGYMWSPNLSRKLRTALQPLVRFRQFCDAKEAFGTGVGEYFNWNVYSDVTDEGRALEETETMPETGFTISQGQVIVTEYGNSVPYTKKLDDLSEQPVTEVIHKVLKNDARKALDRAAYNQFVNTSTGIVATSTSATAATITENGTPTVATNKLTADHVKIIADELAEREIPTYDGNHYVSVGRPRPLRQLKDDLESIHQYVSEGWHVIMNGEKGRYEGIRFVEQTNIAENLHNNVIGVDQVFFFGADTVVEAIAIPEEVRGKIPTDYGRSRGIAWYAELGYAIVHQAVAQQRIIRFDSADTP